MPKHKKDSSDSDSDSGPDDKNPPKKSKGVNSKKVLKNPEGESYWELDRSRRITVREFKNKIFVDIREFYEKDGKTLPGKKGISMSTSQWHTLKDLINEVDDAVKELA